MSQESFLRRFDQAAASAFRSAGVADAALYRSVSGEVIACAVLLDQKQAEIEGGPARVIAGAATITLFKADIANPESGGIVTIGNCSHELDQLVEEDASMSMWTTINE